MGEIHTHDYTSIIGQSFANFVVVHELGRGTMRTIFNGYQKPFERWAENSQQQRAVL